jgi:MoaA/NifB/PqqE/SkfB family radical SAM enzyme
MIEKILKKLIHREKGKPFLAWQIELTTRCPLCCKMCIRTESKDWQYQDMPFVHFKKILPYLKDVENVVLEGWGESLLYEDLAECIRLIKKEGPQVGFVTCGKGLTENRASELVKAGLDFVGFSIAGTTLETHETIRVNSHLSEILDAIHFLTEEKNRQKINRPKMHLVFLMVKDNVLEVPTIPSFAKGLGIGEVILTNICHTINTWQDEQRVFAWGRGESNENKYEEVVRKAEANAKKLEIELKRPPLSATDVSVCEENPLRNLYISAEGEVSPCVYLYPPLPSPFKRIFCSQTYSVEKVSFGNIFKESFPAIWDSENYKNFRYRFRKREEKFREAYLSFWDKTPMKHLEETAFPQSPESCESCHKMLGV